MVTFENLTVGELLHAARLLKKRSDPAAERWMQAALEAVRRADGNLNLLAKDLDDRSWSAGQA